MTPEKPVVKEIAVRLKAAGYDVPCHWVHTERDRLICLNYEEGNFDGSSNISAPLPSEVVRWLRQCKGMHVYADASRCWTEWYAVLIVKDGSHDIGTQSYPDHDTAQIAGIEAALTLIENQKP